MPILNAPPKQCNNESLQLRVSAQFKSRLQRYAQFLQTAPSYVVTEAHNRNFGKDREFKVWLERHARNAPVVEIENIFTRETSRKS